MQLKAKSWACARKEGGNRESRNRLAQCERNSMERVSRGATPTPPARAELPDSPRANTSPQAHTRSKEGARMVPIRGAFRKWLRKISLIFRGEDMPRNRQSARNA